jgi:hypothetical protein
MSVTFPFPCDNLSFLGATGLKLHTQVAYVRGRCGIAIEVKGQGHCCFSPFPCDNLSFLGATGLKLHTQVAYVTGRCGIAIEVKWSWSKVKVKVMAVCYTISCNNFSFLGTTGLKLHPQVAYVRGRCGIAIEVKGQGQRSRSLLVQIVTTL